MSIDVDRLPLDYPFIQYQDAELESESESEILFKDI